MPLVGRLFFAFGLTIFTLAGLGLLAGILYTVLAQRITLHNPIQGTMWQQVEVFGVKVTQRMVTKSEKLVLALNLPQAPRYPTSLTELTVNRSSVWASDLIRTALTGLLAQGLLEVYRVSIDIQGVSRDRGDGFWPGKDQAVDHRVDHASKRSRLVHLIAPTLQASHERAAGALEARILSVVQEWSRRPEARYWPLSPTVYLLVRAIFEEDRADPYEWLLDLVREDAVAHGFFTKREVGWRRRTLYEPVSLPVGHLRAEGETVRALYDQLAQQQPALAHALKQEIGRGISSRQKSSD